MSPADLSPEDNALIQKFSKLLDEQGGSITHDLNDPEHRAFVKLMHTICGNTPADFPGLHAMIDAPQPQATPAAAVGDAADQWQTAFGVPEVGFVPASGLAAAKGYGTVVNGFQTCNLSVLVLAPNGSFLAHGAAAGQAPQNSLAVLTKDAGALPFVPGSTAMMTYSYKPTSGPGASGTTRGAAVAAASDPVVTEPKQENGNTNSYNPNAICIGLGRPSDLTRCDYIYNEPTQDNPIGRLPLVGNASYTNPIKTLQPGTNFLIDIFVIRIDTGGQTQLDATDLTNVYKNFNIDPANANTLQWNLPMKANTVPPEPPQPYTPVVFSKVPWATEMISYLTVNITVTLDDGTPTGKPITVTIQSSNEPDLDPIDGVTYIKPIEFIWHCLGEDTQVAMADGTTKTIPRIVAGEAVLAAAGGTQATVSVTHNGHHFQDVFVLETADGKRLVASAEHVIFTPDGGVAARELKVGTHVLTPAGSTPLTRVSKEAGNGRNLWNLSLGEAPQIDDAHPAVGQFYANGILVGDARAMRAIRYRQMNDIEWVKAHVPAAFHTDVESTFRQRTRIIER